MVVEIKYYEDMWQEIKNATMTTISKDTGKYPTSEWKTKILRAEHSPIRLGKFIIKLYDIPSYVATHLVRHHIGIEKFVSTRRKDRGYNDEIITRNSPVDIVLELNFQAIINISKVRLCSCADKKTIEVWKMVLETIKSYEPELYYLCVRNCIYRGHCPEFIKCGYADTDDYKYRLDEYRNYCGEMGIKNGKC